MNSLFGIIYEFFVKYIFGGCLKGTSYGAAVFDFFSTTASFGETGTDYLTIPFEKLGFVVYDYNTDAPIENVNIPLGNYLSLIATIITLVIICIFLGLFVRWVFKQFTSILRF